MKVKVLMVDDHPSMIEGYKIILSYNPFGYEVETTAVYNCENAYKLIGKKRTAKSFKIFFLDYSLPPYEAKGISNGEDLAILLRKKNPEAKIVMLTSHVESFILYNIIRNVRPNGLLVKSDFTADELLVAFDKVICGGVYYSETVKKIMTDLSSKTLYLDKKNRQIVSFLAQGLSTKSIPELLGISLSAVEKRKVVIKNYFDIKKGNDEDILRVAREQGFV
jgi:two-component system, NarL family, response regulator NreC